MDFIKSIENKILVFKDLVTQPARERLILGLSIGFFGLGNVDLGKFLEPLKVPALHYVPLVCFVISALLFLFALYRYVKLAHPKRLPSVDYEVPPDAEKGATAFTEADAELFAQLGREDLLRKLKGWILDDQTPLIAVQGESGAGKTSLLRAGLNLALRDSGIGIVYWEAIPSRPLFALALAICRRLDIKEPSENSDDSELISFLLTSVRSRKAVVVIDQFEQLDKVKHGGLFDLLEQAVTGLPPYSFTWVIAYRKEYASEFVELWQSVREKEPEAGARLQTLTVNYFSMSEAHDVISNLLAACGTRVTHELLYNLLENQLTDQGYITPVDLGISVQMLNQIYRTHKSSELTLREFQNLGGEVYSLRRYLELCLERLQIVDKNLISKVLMELVDSHSDKRVAEGLSEADLVKFAPASRHREIKNVLQDLSAPRFRILERINTSELSVYRLVHERFVPAIRHLAGEYLLETEKFREALERQFIAWKAERLSLYLLNGKQLRAFNELKHKLQWEVGDQQNNFISLSIRKLWVSRGFYLFLLIFISLAFSVFYKSYERQLMAEALVSQGLPRDLLSYSSQISSLSFQSSNVTNLKFLKYFRLQHLSVHSLRLRSLDDLPKSLRTLIVQGVLDNQSIKYLPDGLTRLNLREAGQMVNLADLPERLMMLEIGGAEKLVSLKGLPKGVKTLEIWGAEKLASLQGLPEGLKTLVIYGSKKLVSLEGLPQGLTTLKIFSTDSVTSLAGLPEGLNTLEIQSARGLVLLEGLPQGLKTLKIAGAYSVTSLAGLPEGLNTLEIWSAAKLASLQGLPEGLKTLEIRGNFNWSNLTVLPEGLKELKLWGVYNVPSLSGLPEGLERIEIRGANNVTSLGGLPEGLKTLEMGRAEKLVSLEGLPAGLESLKLSDAYGIPSLVGLPDGLANLEIHGPRYLDSLEGLPLGLKSLKYSSASSLETLVGLPDGVKILEIWGADSLLSLEGLPHGLKTLEVYGVNSFASLDGLPEELATLKVTKDSSFSNVKPGNSSKKNIDTTRLPKGLKELELSANANDLNGLFLQLAESLPELDYLTLNFDDQLSVKLKHPVGFKKVVLNHRPNSQLWEAETIKYDAENGVLDASYWPFDEEFLEVFGEANYETICIPLKVFGELNGIGKITKKIAFFENDIRLNPSNLCRELPVTKVN